MNRSPLANMRSNTRMNSPDLRPHRTVSQSFRDRADSAAFYEAWVGAVLARTGLFTVHQPFLIDGKDHGESWDLDVLNYDPIRILPDGGLINRRVEVKSLSVSFENVRQYPYETVLVCSQNSWLRKWPAKDTVQRDFLLVSKPTGCICWIPAGSPVELGVLVTDKSRNETYKAVQTNKGLLRPLQDFVETFNV